MNMLNTSHEALIEVDNALLCLDSTPELKVVAAKKLECKIRSAKGKLLGLELPWQIAQALNLGRSTAKEIIRDWYKLYIFSFIVDDSFDEKNNMNKEEFFASSFLFSSGLIGLKSHLSDPAIVSEFDSSVETSLLGEWRDLTADERSTKQVMEHKNNPILLPIFAMIENSQHEYKLELLECIRDSLSLFQILDDVADVAEDLQHNSANYILTQSDHHSPDADMRNLNEDKMWEELIESGKLEEVLQELTIGFSIVERRLDMFGFPELRNIFSELIKNCYSLIEIIRNPDSFKDVSIGKTVKRNVNALIASS